jgi:hypothetical protein
MRRACTLLRRKRWRSRLDGEGAAGGRSCAGRRCAAELRESRPSVSRKSAAMTAALDRSAWSACSGSRGPMGRCPSRANVRVARRTIRKAISAAVESQTAVSPSPLMQASASMERGLQRSAQRLAARLLKSSPVERPLALLAESAPRAEQARIYASHRGACCSITDSVNPLRIPAPQNPPVAGSATSCDWRKDRALAAAPMTDCRKASPIRSASNAARPLHPTEAAAAHRPARPRNDTRPADPLSAASAPPGRGRFSAMILPIRREGHA